MKLLIFFLCLLPTISWGQLPNQRVIAENGIKSVEVWEIRVDPLTDGKMTPVMQSEINKIKRTTPEKLHVSTWFFNRSGLPDSCWVLDKYVNEKRTFIYQFNEKNQVVFLQENNEDQLVSRSKVEFRKNGTIEVLIWQKKTSDWKVGYTLREDSLVLKTGEITDTTGYYFDDRETGIIARARFDNGKVMHHYAERWTIDSLGVPDSLYIDFVQLDDEYIKNFSDNSFFNGFKLREDGSVIPAHGRTYNSLNFYKRGNIKRPFSEVTFYGDPLGNIMGRSKLEESSEIITQRTFSNVHPQYRIDFKYTRY